LTGPLFQVELVSPERPLFRGQAAAVTAEAHDGEIGILPGHAPLVALLGSGVVRVKTAGLREGTEAFAIRGGFVQVLGMKVSLLVTQAVAAADVDPAKAAAAREKVLEDLRHPKDDAAFAALLDERRWLEAQIRIAGAR
jgi:F-type H+-transporting ATPase subunit epsilon